MSWLIGSTVSAPLMLGGVSVPDRFANASVAHEYLITSVNRPKNGLCPIPVDQIEGERSIVDIHMFMPDFNQMRTELTNAGFKELKTAQEVESALPNAQGVSIVFVNSVCGCAGGIARPGAVLALKNGVQADHLFTVFAGQDKDATTQARTYFAPYPPSSPSIAVLRDGKIVKLVERREIEGSSPQAVASKLAEAATAARA